MTACPISELLCGRSATAGCSARRWPAGQRASPDQRSSGRGASGDTACALCAYYSLLVDSRETIKISELPRVLSQRTARALLEAHDWTCERGGKHVIKMVKRASGPSRSRCTRARTTRQGSQRRSCVRPGSRRAADDGQRKTGLHRAHPPSAWPGSVGGGRRAARVLRL